MLSPVLSGESTFEDIIIHGDGWYIKNGITLYKGHRITEIDREAKTVTSAGGVTEAYDKLLIATGSTPFIIPIPGHKLPGVLAYRDLDDVDAMLERAHQLDEFDTQRIRRAADLLRAAGRHAAADALELRS